MTQRRRDRFDQERHRRQFQTLRGVVVFARLAQMFQVGDVGVVKVGHPRHGRPTGVHLVGNRLANLAHPFDANRTEVVASAVPGRSVAGDLPPAVVGLRRLRLPSFRGRIDWLSGRRPRRLHA